MYLRELDPHTVRPHIPSRLGRNDQFVAVGRKSFFRIWPKVSSAIRKEGLNCWQIEMGDAEIRSAAQHGAGWSNWSSREIVPEPSETRGV